MQCTLGASPASIVVTRQTFSKINGCLVATQMDKAPMVNIPSFGVCKCASPNSPVFLARQCGKEHQLYSICGSKRLLTVASFCMCKSRLFRSSFVFNFLLQFVIMLLEV